MGHEGLDEEGVKALKAKLRTRFEEKEAPRFLKLLSERLTNNGNAFLCG